MTNREKVIKVFETEIMNFTPACTSDELLKEVMETALKLLKNDGCENCAMAVEDRQMIVRCKDCKHQDPDRFDDGEGNYVCRKGHGWKPDNWFCADGERKEGR